MFDFGGRTISENFLGARKYLKIFGGTKNILILQPNCSESVCHISKLSWTKVNDWHIKAKMDRRIYQKWGICSLIKRTEWDLAIFGEKSADARTETRSLCTKICLQTKKVFHQHPGSRRHKGFFLWKSPEKNFVKALPPVWTSQNPAKIRFCPRISLYTFCIPETVRCTGWYRLYP